MLAASCDVVTPADRDGVPVDVVIYDLLRPTNYDGNAVARVVEQHPDRVLALFHASRPGLAARALQLGAVAAILVSADEKDLVTAIRAAVGGHLRDGSVADLANKSERARLLGLDLGLSWRERQVLALITTGACNGDIAAVLYVSINTVKTYVRTSYRKIGVTNRAQAVAWGVEHGFPTSLAAVPGPTFVP